MSAPKCSTPQGSPPQLSGFDDTSSISTDCDSSTCSSSLSEISSNLSYAPSTKRRKIRQKVEAVLSNVVRLVKDQGETLGELIAHSCLLKRFKKLDGKQIVCDVFSKVAQQSGVQKAFSELIPDELWHKRVDMMAVPDWQLLLCKLEAKISDD